MTATADKNNASAKSQKTGLNKTFLTVLRKPILATARRFKNKNIERKTKTEFKKNSEKSNGKFGLE